jgi:pimeloyl-ACP methyl ester carboxylesterase
MLTGILPKLLLAIVVAACALFSFVYFNQEKLIFHPERLPADHRFSFPAPFEEVVLDSGGVGIHTLLFPKENSQGVILYFHGNAGALNSWGGVYADFESVPYDLWIMDYRGFGKSAGTLSGEADLQADAQALFDAAQARYAGKEMVLYGRSIGTGVASALAAKYPPKMLILETPYFNFPDLVAELAPWAPSALLRYKLMNNEYLRDQPFPIHLIHGDRDELISASHSARLAELGPHIEFHTIKGAGHNNISAFSRYHALIKEIFQSP